MTLNDGTMTSLKDILADLFGEGGLPFVPEDADIWKVWEEVVGPVISKSAQPHRIKEGRLRVTVTDPIWLQELEFMEKAIREKLNARLARAAVKRIEFRLGSF
ncbi:MAG: DUF721 domain-containing protein [Thermodesulfobacteriota bacterium]|nr:DUF721 domain-containing protein [Thermodesulfobacteriota bacterium]